MATPVGGVIAGIFIARYGRVSGLITAGAVLIALGNALVTSLQFTEATWKYYVYLLPGNLGQGIVYLAATFAFIATSEKQGSSIY